MNVIAIDVGGTNIKHGIIDSNGTILKKGIEPTCKKSLGEFIHSIEIIIENYLIVYEVKALCFSCPGSVDPYTKIIHGSSALKFIHENTWILDLGKKYSLEVSVENDANCAALAEAISGNGKECNIIFSLVVGTGIGGSLVINKQVIHGENLYTGEIGYCYMNMSNYCEKDLYERTVSHNISTSALVREVDKEVTVENGKEVFEQYELGNEKVIKIIDNYFVQIATVIFNLNHILNPGKILVGGGVADRIDFIDGIKKQYEILSDKHPHKTVPFNVNNCYYTSDANLIGAYYNYLNTK